MPLEEIIAADGNKIITRFFAPGREARGRRLRKVGDLPKGVMQQWRRWCLNPEYAVGAEGESVRAQYAAVRTPVVYVNAPRKMKRIAPQELGVPRIGHFGFFRPAYRHSLWQAHLLPELT